MKPAGLKSVRRPSDLEEQRRKKTDSEEKLPDKNRVHSFILDLELGTEERRKNIRKDSLSKEKERKEKERVVPDERLKSKLKTESRKSGDAAADEKDGGTAKGAADEKKGSKVKPDRKSSVSSRESKTSVSEAADEGNLKKGRSAVNEKEKPKGDSKLLRRLDSTGSSEERSEVETGSELSRKKDKQPKEILKRSKSHPEAKPGEKPKVRTDRKDSSVDKTHPQKSGSETESDVRKTETGPKVKSLTEKHKSKPQNPTAGKSEKKTEAKSKPGTAEQKKEDKKTSEEKTKDAKVAKKTAEKKVEKDSESKSGGTESPGTGEPVDQTHPVLTAPEPPTVSSSTPLPDDPYAALSDVTPEPEDEDAVLKEPRPLTAEADALLSLMDVHTSASELAVRRETEADMKMKEAALALLSMDPDIARSSDLISDSQVAMETLPAGTEDTGSGLEYSETESAVIATSAAAAEPMETDALGIQEVTSEVNT
ncbi:hypothetical protein cypCar_00046403 [Cyprinus carpio]|nr:hypothetical protein cypCar_00046403 [Cyprinus carpio]